MKIRYTTRVSGPDGEHLPGDVAEVTCSVALRLIGRRVAEKVVECAAVEPAENAMSNRPRKRKA